MNDETAKTARLMNVAEAAVEEFDGQGVAEVMANLGFDPMALARALIKAADGDVVQFVSYGMTVSISDGFKAVQVKHQNRELVCDAGVEGTFIESFLENAAIWQAG
jgi:hypothetical protein